MTSDAIAPILDWLHTHPNLAGLVTFLVSAAESIAIIGTIVPGSITMTAIGTLAGAGVIPLWSTLFWGILGAAAGDNLSFWAGHHYKSRLRKMWPFNRYPQLLQSGELFFKKHGPLSVIIGRFIGPVRALVPIVAGMLGMKPLYYISASLFASTLWALLYMLPGVLLGEATLELPRDVAIHALLMGLFVGFSIFFALWVTYHLCMLISKQINQFLNLIWQRLQRSRYFHIFVTVLKHHDYHQTHGQLTLGFYVILACSAFTYVATLVFWHNPADLIFNKIFFYLFRSLHTPTRDSVMLAITLAGDKKVLIPVIAALFVWLAYCKNWRTAFHALALIALTSVSVVAFKHFIHCPRPWGILNNSETFSFPSGHTTVSTSFYLGLGILLSTTIRKERRWLIYSFFIFIVAAISLSRLYLGAHWFTDVVGGLLLSSILLMVVSLSYNRQYEKPIKASGVIITVLLAFLCSYTYQYHSHIDKMRQDYTIVDWPIKNLSMNEWWEQKNDEPLKRIGRIGLPAEVLNLQWIGNISSIQKLLLEQGWELPPAQNWISVIYCIADDGKDIHLPLVSPLYMDKRPSLVLVKHVDKDKLIALRLWDSHTRIFETNQPLWVGSVEAVPRTYSWIIKYKNRYNITLDTNLLFNAIPKNYEIKTVSVNIHVKRKHKWEAQPIILIRPI